MANRLLRGGEVLERTGLGARRCGGTRRTVASPRVAFRIPGVLAPISAMQDPTHPLLSAIEMGAYNPIQRRLVELGVPRETALRGAGVIDEGGVLDSDGVVSDTKLGTELWARIDSFNQWETWQIQETIPPTVL